VTGLASINSRVPSASLPTAHSDAEGQEQHRDHDGEQPGVEVAGRRGERNAFLGADQHPYRLGQILEQLVERGHRWVGRAVHVEIDPGTGLGPQLVDAGHGHEPPPAAFDPGEDEYQDRPEAKSHEDERAHTAVPGGEYHGHGRRFVFEHYWMTVPGPHDRRSLVPEDP
jgi:hypothetical protein